MILADIVTKVRALNNGGFLFTFESGRRVLGEC